MMRKCLMARDSVLTEETTAEFERNSVVVINGIFVDWVSLLKRGIEKNIAKSGPFVRDYREKGKGIFFTDYCHWDRIDENREFLSESPVADTAGQLMHSN